MRPVLLLLAVACAAPKPLPPRATPQCDALPLLGAAEIRALVSDGQGGLLAAGEFSGPLRAAAASASSAGGTDVFVLRTEPNGDVRWLRRLGSAGDERAGAAAMAPNGDAVVTGTAGGRCFVARLAAADGRDVWNFAFDTESACRALAFDAEGDLWAAGSYSGLLFRTASSAGITDAFVARISGAAGGVNFVRGFGGKGRDVARAIAVAPSGDVIVAGQFGGEVNVVESDVDFGRGPTPSQDFDAFVVGLAPDGSTRWVRTFGDSGDDDLAALAVDPSATVFAAGHHQPAGNYQGLVAGGVGNYTAQIVRISALGRGEWVRIFDGESSSAAALTFDAQGRLWAAGSFEGSLQADGVSLKSAGKSDAFAVALSPADGSSLGVRSFGTPQADQLRAAARIPGGLALAGSTKGEIQVCGKLVGSPGEATAFVAWLRDLTP